MSKLEEVASAVERGKAKLVPGLVEEALDEGIDPVEILNKGMIDAMSVVGEKFKNNEIFVPEMLVAARAMKKGVEVLKPSLAGSADVSIGKAVIGTVQGDLQASRSRISVSTYRQKDSWKLLRIRQLRLSAYPHF